MPFSAPISTGIISLEAHHKLLSLCFKVEVGDEKIQTLEKVSSSQRTFKVTSKALRNLSCCLVSTAVCYELSGW